MFDYSKITNAKTFAFSSENPNGVRSGGNNKECQKIKPFTRVEANQTITLAEIDGAGKIEHLWFGGDVSQWFILRVYWDFEEKPSVEVPLSAFFGNFYNDNHVDRDGNYVTMNTPFICNFPHIGGNCYFQMPFKKHCKITLENRLNDARNIFYTITGEKGEQPSDAGYFHATYRQAKPNEKGKPYVAIDGIEGKGHFVGLTMGVGLNGNSTCWVEGEARIYLDGEENPSLHYTGTEDYFCGSFAFGNDAISHKYQPYQGDYVGVSAIMGDTNKLYENQQRFHLYRFHIADPIRFENGIKVTFDNLGWTGPRYDDYATVCYFYMQKPFTSLKPLPTPNELVFK